VQAITHAKAISRFSVEVEVTRSELPYFLVGAISPMRIDSWSSDTLFLRFLRVEGVLNSGEKLFNIVGLLKIPCCSQLVRLLVKAGLFAGGDKNDRIGYGEECLDSFG